MHSATLTVDTHKVVKHLLGKGFSEEQAEGFIEAIQEINLSGVATKEDVAQLRAATRDDIIELRTATKDDIAQLRAQMKEEIGQLRTEIKADRAELYKFMFVQALGIVGLTVALVKVIPQL